MTPGAPRDADGAMSPGLRPVLSGRAAPRDRGAPQPLFPGVIAAILVIAALDQASGVAVPTVVAVLAAIALAPLTRRIERLRAPPALAAAVIVAGILVVTGATIYALLPSAEAWNDRAPQVSPAFRGARSMAATLRAGGLAGGQTGCACRPPESRELPRGRKGCAAGRPSNAVPSVTGRSGKHRSRRRAGRIRHPGPAASGNSALTGVFEMAKGLS